MEGLESEGTLPSLNASLNAGSGQIPPGMEDFDVPASATLGPAGQGGTGGGMQVFGIGKDGITRAIIKFLTPPKPQPLTLCFQFPGVFLSHKFVIVMFKSILMGMENANVVSVQFVDRNVALGTRNLDNRWLITVNLWKPEKNSSTLESQLLTKRLGFGHMMKSWRKST